MGWGPTAWVETDVVDNLMNVNQQCALVVRTTSSIMGCMNQACSHHVERLFLSVPGVFWPPQYKQDTTTVVQPEATRVS